MTDLSQFKPLEDPRTPVVCQDTELARDIGYAPPEYEKEMHDGSRPASYREYEMWHLGRKYAHELHLGLLQDTRAMAEAHELAETTRRNVNSWRQAKCWSPDNQRSFLDLLAGGASVTEACDIIEISKQSAYRHRARDKYFAIAWDAALELARPRVLEDFVERARTGQLETWRRIGPDGKMTIVERRRYDNAHALRVLDRLDEASAGGGQRGDRVADAVDDFDGWLAALGTPEAAAKLLPPEPEPEPEIDPDQLAAEVAAEVERYLNDPLPHMGDNDFANSLRAVFMAKYDEDEDEDGDEDEDEHEGDGERVTGDEKVTVASHPVSPDASGHAPHSPGDGTQRRESRLDPNRPFTGRVDNHDEHQGRQD